MNDTRKIRFEGTELGLLNLDQLYRMALDGEIDHGAEFWSVRQKAWRPLVCIMSDFEPSRLGEMRAAGIKRVRVLGPGEVCPVCTAICASEYPIDQAPSLPPPDCTCEPWCRCVIIAVA